LGGPGAVVVVAMGGAVAGGVEVVVVVGAVVVVVVPLSPPHAAKANAANNDIPITERGSTMFLPRERSVPRFLGEGQPTG